MSQSFVIPKRQRSSVFFHVSNILGIYELHVGYKTAKENIQPLTSSKQGSQIKIPFGPPIRCQFSLKKTKEGEDIEILTFYNVRKQIVEKPASLLNGMEFVDNRFSRKITSLTVEGKKELLMFYLSKLNFVEGFVYHREGIHSPHGFEIEESLNEERGFQEMGGSLSEFRQLITYAKDGAQMVESMTKSLDKIRQFYNQGRKRKILGSSECEVSNKKNPSESCEVRGKPESIAKAEMKELEDQDGLAKTYQKSLCAIGHIPLDNISVSSSMEVKVSDDRVEYIKESILKHYNPALSVLVVCPVNNGKKIDYNEDKFFVVQKIKVLLAFKKLDKAGDFEKLYGHHHRKVLCYILNNNSPALMQFANLNENYLAGQFSNKTLLQDLFHHFDCLTKADSNINSIKVVERMGRLCCFRCEDYLAVLKICKWSSSGYCKFMEVLNCFEKYETKDPSRSGSSERISKGLKRILPNLWIKRLSKITEEDFVQRQSDVLNYALPLKDLADQAHDKFELQRVSCVLSKIANCTPVETLRLNYPGSFDDSCLKDYIGALIDGKGKNMKATELSNYYDCVVKTGNKQSSQNPLFESVNNIKDIFSRSGLVDENNLTIYNIAAIDIDVLNQLIHSVLNGKKFFKAALLLCSSMEQYSTISTFIKSQNTSTVLMSNYKFIPLYFKREKVLCSKKVGENLHFGILFGCFIILKDPLLVYYSDILMVRKVVEGICPPNSSIDFLADSGQMLYDVHDDDSKWNVRYFAPSFERNRQT